MVNAPISNSRAGFHFVKLGVLQQPVFFQAPFHQRQREGRAVHRHVDFAEQERNRADVIFVAMRQDQRAHLVAILFEIREVGRDDVDAQQFGVRKHHAGVHDDDVVPVADGHRVHAELAQTAERDQLQACDQTCKIQVIRWLGRRWLVVGDASARANLLDDTAHQSIRYRDR